MFLLGIAATACVGTLSGDRAGCPIDPISRGIAALHAAFGASSAAERQRHCSEAEESCRIGLDGEFFNRAEQAKAHNCLGLVERVCRNRNDAAVERFQSAIACDGTFAEPHNNLGVMLAERRPPDHAGAIEQYRSALAIEVGYVDARENLVLSLIQLGHWNQARSQCKRLLEIAPPGDPTPHYYLGLVEGRVRRLEEAAQHLQQCLVLDPEHADCKAELAKLSTAMR